MPSTSIDTFFACTIIVAAALISTAFLSSTMQTTLNIAQDINKESYLKAIAEHIITNPGTPLDWGTKLSIPSDFGLAASPSTIPYDVDIDKISRLNNQNNYSLSYFDMANSAKLSKIAFGVTVSQIMFINIQQTSNSTIGSDIFFTFKILTSIDSKSVNASLHCYIVANNFQSSIVNVTSGIGLGYITIQIPITSIENAMLIVFAKSSFDDRITSYAVYNFVDSTEETAPRNDVLALSPLDYNLSITSNSSRIMVQDGFLFSYQNQRNISYVPGSTQCEIPKMVDKSPFVIVVQGVANGSNFQEWTSYPQVPLKAGSNFEGSEQNIFSYIVTVKDALYKVDISLGDESQ